MKPTIVARLIRRSIPFSIFSSTVKIGSAIRLCVMVVLSPHVETCGTIPETGSDAPWPMFQRRAGSAESLPIQKNGHTMLNSSFPVLILLQGVQDCRMPIGSQRSLDHKD